jgi:hypothetical protein
MVYIKFMIYLFLMLYTMMYIMMYTMWYIPCGIFHESLELWLIPSKSGIYHGETFQMVYAVRTCFKLNGLMD